MNETLQFMNPVSPESNLRLLRSQFLKESKLFCKALESNSIDNANVKGQVLDEMRTRLKSLLELINELEKQELAKTAK